MAAADDPPPEIHDAMVDPMGVDPSSAKPPSPTKPADEAPLQQATEYVIITGTGYTELGNPTILAKDSAKEELIQKNKAKFDVSNYSHLGVSELYSGYLSQLHTGRDLEADLVKKLRHKYEVWTPAWYMMHILSASKSNAYDKIEYVVDLEYPWV